ncbi:beta-defensin-like 2 [Carassius gibelio]|uniref:beta-defensin-like 2 n=1 Tax=Carassius gibelio TaxID=101364 RepID=UPI002278B052|nr:beta-defensin-like 2 [Carassius gibelio]
MEKLGMILFVALLALFAGNGRRFLLHGWSKFINVSYLIGECVAYLFDKLIHLNIHPYIGFVILEVYVFVLTNALKLVCKDATDISIQYIQTQQYLDNCGYYFVSVHHAEVQIQNWTCGYGGLCRRFCFDQEYIVSHHGCPRRYRCCAVRY